MKGHVLSRSKTNISGVIFVESTDSLQANDVYVFSGEPGDVHAEMRDIDPGEVEISIETDYFVTVNSDDAAEALIIANGTMQEETGRSLPADIRKLLWGHNNPNTVACKAARQLIEDSSAIANDIADAADRYETDSGDIYTLVHQIAELSRALSYAYAMEDEEDDDDDDT